MLIKKYLLLAFLNIVLLSNNTKSYSQINPNSPFIPTGYKETKDLVFFELDKQGSIGTVEKVISDYNKYIVGTEDGFDEIATTKEQDIDTQKSNKKNKESKSEINESAGYYELSDEEKAAIINDLF